MSSTEKPQLCYVKIAGARNGERIGIVKRGESGYYLTDFDNCNASDEIVEQAVADFNKRLGVDPAEAIAMETGAMFGWDVPGANADRYRESAR